MTSREEISLQLTKSIVEKIGFSVDTVKTLPYEIYNSIYDNIKTQDTKPKNL